MTEAEKRALIEDLYRTHSKKIAAVAGRLCSNRELAQDIVHEVFLVAMSRIDEFSACENQQAWLFTVMSNLIGRVYRKRKMVIGLQEKLRVYAQEEGYEDGISIEALYGGLMKAETLQLLIWLYCDGRTYPEIAEKLQISLPACRKRIQRAKALLRERLLEEENAASS